MSSNTREEHKRSFGSKFISLKSLNKNKLSLFSNCGSHAGIKYEMITDSLKNIIKAIIRGDIYTVEDAVDALDDIDRKILFRALKYANIEVDWDSVEDDTKNQLIHKFNVFKDEIMMGNRSEETISQFKAVIDECLDKKLLGKQDYTRLCKLVN
jgi:hypothetical protein